MAERGNVALMGLAIVTAVVYARVLGLDFVGWDDSITVYANPYLNPLSWSNLAHFWGHAYEGLYIPLSYTMYGLLRLASTTSVPDPRTGVAVDPLLFHVASVGLHIANTWMVFIILRMLVRKDPAAALGALVFAVNPLQVESVAWISELRGLFSGFFSLAAVALYVSHALAAAQGGRETFRSRSYLFALGFTFLAMLCKPTAVTVPVILFALDRWCVGRPLRRCLTSSGLFVVPSLAIFLLTMAAQPVAASLFVPVWQRPFVAADALAFYVAKFAVPIPLAIVYGRTPDQVLQHWYGYATWIVPAGLALLVWMKRASIPWVVAAGMVSLAALLPNLGLLPFKFQVYSTVADRYAYLALFGPGLAVAYLLANPPHRLATALVGVVLAIWGVLSIVQIGYWDNDLVLWSHAVRVGGSDTAYVNYANVQVTNRSFAAATQSYRQAIRVNPRNADAQQGLGAALLDTGHFADAITALQICVRLRPDSGSAHYQLGIALAEAGNTSAALVQLRQAERLSPDAATRAVLTRAVQKFQQDLKKSARKP